MFFIRHPKRLGSKNELSSIKRSRIGETDTTAHMRLKVYTPTPSMPFTIWHTIRLDTLKLEQK